MQLAGLKVPPLALPGIVEAASVLQRVADRLLRDVRGVDPGRVRDRDTALGQCVEWVVIVPRRDAGEQFEVRRAV